MGSVHTGYGPALICLPAVDGGLVVGLVKMQVSWPGHTELSGK